VSWPRETRIITVTEGSATLFHILAISFFNNLNRMCYHYIFFKFQVVAFHLVSVQKFLRVILHVLQTILWFNYIKTRHLSEEFSRYGMSSTSHFTSLWYKSIKTQYVSLGQFMTFCFIFRRSKSRDTKILDSCSLRQIFTGICLWQLNKGSSVIHETPGIIPIVLHWFYLGIVAVKRLICSQCVTPICL
jgi:hypothetical protein